MVNLITDHIDIWTAAQTQKTNGGRGRGNGSANQSPHGIKKLRELILELAVRGKLVPQDPNDETASVLLKKIAKEKARLIKEDKIKKQKPLPEINEDEKPFYLPEGWEWFRTGNVFNFQYGKALPAKSRDDSGNVDVYGSNGIVGKYIEALTNEQCIVIGRKGSAGALNKAHRPSWTTDVSYFIVPPQGFDFDYTFLILQALKLDKLGKGIKPGLNRNEAYALVTALPPLNEQRRIVSKVDELMILCDKLEQQQTDSNAAHKILIGTFLATLTSAADKDEFIEAWQRIAKNFDTLFTTEHSIDQLKQTILQLAVMGKLVPQDPNDEPAIVLLEKIAKEKARLIKKGKIKEQKKLPEISEDEEPFELPLGWEWTKLGTISLINPRNEAEDDSPASFVPMTLINPSYTGEHGQEDRIWGSIKQGYTHFANGDIGLAKITPCFENSKAVVFSNLKNGFGAGTTELHISRPFGKTLCARYVLLYLKSPQFLLLGETKMTGTAGQKRVPKDFFAENPFPLPPIAEQHRIVAKVDELMAICDTLKARLNDAQITQVQLADAIVEQAVA